MTSDGVDLHACDREPIHIPGAIQPHGLMLVAEAETGRVVQAAGDVEARLGRTDWLGASYRDLLGIDEPPSVTGGEKVRLRDVRPPGAQEAYGVSIHRTRDRLIVELEPTEATATTVDLLLQLEASAALFERAADLGALCGVAAAEFRRLTRYDRVMVYQFLDDQSGVVVGEDLAEGQYAFLRHHFPASDIPKQARALYVRNLVRVIPDVGYETAPLRPSTGAAEPLDMSDCELRSVSPVHLQYLKNMGVAASASVSIVKDGRLWGLVACHNATPRTIDPDRRIACRTLAAILSRQIKAREETDSYRERVRLRTYEDGIVEILLREGSLETAISNHLDDLTRMFDCDGVAVIRGREVVRGGEVPSEAEIARLSDWIARRPNQPVFATHELGASFELAAAERSRAGGALALTLSATTPWIVLWFRAEEVQVVNWAGNPHKDDVATPGDPLTPRSSFAAWTETVRGRSRRWSVAEIESAKRLRSAVLNLWQTREIVELNRRLFMTIEQKDGLLKQNAFLLGEISHRVQNSLQLVSSFLALQARELDEPALSSAFEEARRRIAAVSLVHRRLYNSDHYETLDAGRYVEELLDDMATSLGREWEGLVSRDLEPIVLPNDRAVSLGLVLTELIINASKYAYDGSPGPIRVTLSESENQLQLVVEDQGKGRRGTRVGFGTRMLNALVDRLAGTLDYQDSDPGTRAVVSAPIAGR